MRKTKKVDLKLSNLSEVKVEESVTEVPLDVLTVKVLSIRIPEKQKEAFAIKITFYDEIILDTVITSSWSKEAIDENVIAQGSMNYDPSNYEKMCFFADVPLIVTITPVSETLINIPSLETIGSSLSQAPNSQTVVDMRSSKSNLTCNVDILPIFLDMDVMHVRVRMQQEYDTPILDAISWENLPLLTMEISVKRHESNEEHQTLLAQANYFKLTLVGCYNLPDSNADLSVFTAASKTTAFNETNVSVIKFNEGFKSSKRFSDTSFYPKWESLRLNKTVNSHDSKKFQCKLHSIQNEDGIDLKKYFTDSSKCNNVIWASFHRTLLLKETVPWLCDFLRQFSWPFELKVTGNAEYAMMGFLNLFKLLYPGVDTVRVAVPLLWLDEAAMQQKCASDALIVEERVPSAISTNQRSNKHAESDLVIDADTYHKPTGYDGNTAFVIVEVALRYPFKKPVIPTHISNDEIKDMLRKMEVQKYQRECTGRGQQIGDWQNIVKTAMNALRRIPYYGSTDFCTFDHQLSLTRTRVEILSSFSDEAAIYVNNNFVTENFLESSETFEELLLMSHACLVNEATKALSDLENWPKIDPLIRSARHARYFQDIYHAAELYFYAVSQNKHDANCWRELGTCLLDIDPDWADVCIDKSLMINPRHPLTLLSKGCIILKKNPEEAEQFFLALLFFHPLWLVGMVAANAYFIKREYYEMADKIMEWVHQAQAQGLSEMLNIARAWEHELGDWWESTPLLPGTSVYYDAADLLLRIRAINLAEVCIAQAFTRNGDSPPYYHLLALCCRLSGDLDKALCHIQEGLKKFGEVNCLRALEAECYHVRKDHSSSVASFEKAAPNYGSYSTLLSMLGTGTERSRSLLAELLRRQPSAYTWLAYADEWIAMAREEKRPRSLNYDSTAIKYAIACADQALKIDKRAGRAWSLLAKLVRPTARKVYCARMAVACGLTWPKERVRSPSRQTLCHRLGKTLRECRCQSCTALAQ